MQPKEKFAESWSPNDDGATKRRRLSFAVSVARGAEAHFFGAAAAGAAVSGSSFFLSLPAINGLQGCARIGPFVFHTTLKLPSAFTSPREKATTGTSVGFRPWLPSSL